MTHSIKRISPITAFFMSFVVLPGLYLGLNAQNVDAQANGASIIFNITPQAIGKTCPAVTMIIDSTIDKQQLTSFCGASGAFYRWEIYGDLPGIDILISEGTQDLAVSPNNQTYTHVIPVTLSQTFSSLNPTESSSGLTSAPRSFYAFLECPGGANLTEYKYFTINVSDTCPYSGGNGQQPIQGGKDVNLGWNIINPLAGKPTNVFGVIFIISNWILNIAGALIVLLIIYAGVRFMISRGNPGEIQRAKSILKWALAGFAVILIGKGFIFVIEAFLSNQIPNL